MSFLHPVQTTQYFQIMPPTSETAVTGESDLALRVRQLEKALAESEERFEKTFSASADGITVTDLVTSRYININEGFTRIFGYTREEAVGRLAVELSIWAYPKDRDSLVQEIKRCGRVRDFIAVGRNKDGSFRTCSLSGEVVEISGNPSLVLVVRDITEQLRTERALREALERFSKSFMVSPDAICLCEVESRRFVEVNDSFLRLMGVSRGEALGHTARELGFYARREDEEHLARALRTEEGARGFELRIRRSNGEERTVLFSGEFMTLDGSEHCLIVLHDITELQRAASERALLQEQLQQAQKLEALGTLAGGIAHDFNNILTAIMAYSEMAVMDAEDPDEVRSHLDEVHKASLRARDLVRQILSFSRMKKAERRPVCIAEVVREAISLLRSSLPSTIHILEEGLEGDQALVMADPTQLHQVIMNLGTNSTHAMRGRAGVLTFGLAQLPADAPELDGARPARVCIMVSDTGSGMSPEVLARLFEPFFTTKGQGEGTGLGMSVVHGIVQSHGGTIAVESQVGVGTSVRIELPLHTGELRSAEPAVGGLPQGRGEALLFIDDEPQICQFAQKMLTRLGYHVTSCTNPLEALGLLVPGQCGFALVVTDLTMPNMTGIELARRIRGGHPRLPILLSSGLPGMWNNERLAEVGINGLLTKPLSIQSLAGAVRRMLDAPLPEPS